MNAGTQLEGSAEQTTRRPRQQRSRRRWGRVVLVAALILMVGAATAAVGYLWNVERTVNRNITRLPDAFPDATDRPVQSSGNAANAVTVLLLGSDKRPAGSGITGQRSDTMMLVHLTAERDGVHVVSIPRDSYVDIPGHGKNKINAAFAFGGYPLAVQTVEQLTGVRIDHVASIDFDGFLDLTNALGGVDVHNERAWTDPETGFRYEVGLNHLKGEKALAFVQERPSLPQGDFDRMANQQRFLRGVAAKMLSTDTLTDPVRLSNALTEFSRNVSVDDTLDAGQLRSLALSMRSIRQDDVHFMTTPVAGTGTSPAGASIVNLSPDMENLWAAMREDRMETYAPAQ